MGTDSEDFPLISRSEPLLSSKPRTQRENVFPGSISIQFLSMGTILGEEPANSLLCGFAFAFDRHAKSLASSCTANSPNCSSGITVSLFKSITKLFDS